MFLTNHFFNRSIWNFHSPTIMLLGLFMYHFAMRPHKKCEQCKFTNSTVRKTFLRLFSRTGNPAERYTYPARLGIRYAYPAALVKPYRCRGHLSGFCRSFNLCPIFRRCLILKPYYFIIGKNKVIRFSVLILFPFLLRLKKHIKEANHILTLYPKNSQ